MARYYKRRIYRRIYPRKRWATNFITGNTSITAQQGATGGYVFTTLCENSLQSQVPTPVLLKYGRTKIKGDIRTSDSEKFSDDASCVCYVVYMPQAYVLDPNVITQHPEWILGWTSISCDSGNTFSISSTLKRNLNSGDSIKLLFILSTVHELQRTRYINFFYTGQYWTTSS